MLKSKELNNEKDMFRACDLPDAQLAVTSKELGRLKAISLDEEVFVDGVQLAKLLGYDNAWVAIGMTASEPIDFIGEHDAMYISKDDVLALYEDAPLLMTDNDKATEIIDEILNVVFPEMNALVKHMNSFNEDDYDSEEECDIAYERHMDSFRATDYMTEEEKIRYGNTKELGDYLDDLADFLNGEWKL